MCFCVFVFFYEKHKLSNLCVFLQQKNCTREPMCFCVFVFVFLRKTQKHNDPILLCLFSAIEQHQRTDVFLCFFFNEKHKNKRTKFCLCFFFSNIIAPENHCVFVFFLRKAQRQFFLVFSAIELQQRAYLFLLKTRCTATARAKVPTPWEQNNPDTKIERKNKQTNKQNTFFVIFGAMTTAFGN